MSGANKLKISLIVMALLLFSATVVCAAPASPEGINIEQPSGQSFLAKLQGDEWSNWVENDQDKAVILQDDDGYWKYAEVSYGELQPTEARVGIDPAPANVVNGSDWASKLVELREDPIVPTTYYDSGVVAQAVAPKPAGGPQKVLVLLVSFTDIGIQNSETAWSNRFFGDIGDTVKNYFKENSYNNFYFTPAGETYGTANDGIVKVSLGYNHPNTGSSTGDANRLIVKNALIAADAYVNFATYDTNGNGYIENSELHVVTIVAGYERSCGVVTPNVWGHRWSFWGTVVAPQLDGKYVGASGYGGYTQQGEIHAAGGNHMATIGILCHELSHDIGLADLYNTSTGGSVVGASSLMDGGSWGYGPGDYIGGSPAHIDPWGKIYLGFTSASVVTSGTYDMKAASTGAYNALRFNTTDTDEYFLIENRNRSGFDDGLYYDGISNGGIAIWHIEESIIASTMALNKVNNGTTKGIWLETSTSSMEPYFRSGGPQNIFDNASTPNSKLYSGSPSGLTATVLDATATSMRVQIGASDSVQFSPNSYSVAENGASINLTVTRTGSTAGILTVDYQTANGTALAGQDYTAASGTLTFGDAEAVKTLTVPIGLDDNMYEGNETFSVILSNSSSGTITTPVATVTITDDETVPTLRLSAAPTSVIEGGTVTVTATRTGATGNAVTVNYATANGTALVSSDYTAATGTLAFGTGETVKTFTVATIDDTAFETNETFRVSLSGAGGGAVLGSPITQTLTIIDNEEVPVIQLATATSSVAEGSSLAITVNRSGNTSGTSTVAYTTTNGTATAGTDYAATTGTLTFAAGQSTKTVNVNITNDGAFEGDETFTFALSNPGMATLGAIASTTINITDDEVSLLRFAEPTYSVNEGGTVTVTVERIGTATGAASVSYATSGGTAVAGTHYNAVSGTLSFAAGEVTKTVSIDTIDNDIAQGSKTLVVTLSGPVGSSLIGTDEQSHTTVTITDDDVPSGTVVNIEFANTVAWIYISEIGASVQAHLNGIYADGSKGDITSLATWTIEDKSVATISDGGLITAVEYGYTSVYATYGGRTVSVLLGVIDPNS